MANWEDLTNAIQTVEKPTSHDNKMYIFDNDGKIKSNAIPTQEEAGTFSKQNWQTPVGDRVDMSEVYKNMVKNGGEYNPVSPFSDKALDDILRDISSDQKNQVDSDPARYMQDSIKYSYNFGDVDDKPVGKVTIGPDELNDECLE